MSLGTQIFADRDDLWGLGVGSYVAAVLAFLGLLTWIFGKRFLLPSLGPSIFALATLPDERLNLPRRYVGGQFIGLIAAFVATEALLGGLAAQGHVKAFSPVLLQQVGASLVAVLLTTIGMHVTNLQHPPAYATTLVVSLGFLNDLASLGIFLLAVVLVAGFHEIVGKRFPIWNLPYEEEREDEERHDEADESVGNT